MNYAAGAHLLPVQCCTATVATPTDVSRTEYTVSSMARGGGYDGGGGGGGRGGRGGKGGKGQKPQFTRVIPKFLQQYETMLNGPKPPRTGYVTGSSSCVVQKNETLLGVSAVASAA